MLSLIISALLVTQRLDLLLQSLRYLRFFFIFSSVYFLSFVQIRYFYSQVHWFFSSSSLFCCQAHWVFILVIVFILQLQNFYLILLYIFCSFAETSCFFICFKHVHNYSLKYFCDICLKFCLDKSNIHVTLVSITFSHSNWDLPGFWYNEWLFDWNLDILSSLSQNSVCYLNLLL